MSLDVGTLVPWMVVPAVDGGIAGTAKFGIDVLWNL